MTDEKTKSKRTKKSIESVYTNTGQANIFTARGRVVPGGEITLFATEAKVDTKLVRIEHE